MIWLLPIFLSFAGSVVIPSLSSFHPRLHPSRSQLKWKSLGQSRRYQSSQRIACHRFDDLNSDQPFSFNEPTNNDRSFKCKEEYIAYLKEMMMNLDQSIDAFHHGSEMTSPSKQQIVEIFTIYSQREENDDDGFNQFVTKLVAYIALSPDYNHDEIMSVLQEFDLLSLLQSEIMNTADAVSLKQTITYETRDQLYRLAFNLFAWIIYTPSKDTQYALTTIVVRRLLRSTENNSITYFLIFALQSIAFAVHQQNSHHAVEAHFDFEKIVLSSVSSELFALWQEGNFTGLKLIIQQNFLTGPSAISLARWNTVLSWMYTRVGPQCSDDLFREESECLGLTSSVFQTDLVSFFPSDQVETPAERKFSKWIQDTFQL